MNYQTVLQNYHPTEQGWPGICRLLTGERCVVLYRITWLFRAYSLAIGFCPFIGYAADERTG